MRGVACLESQGQRVEGGEGGGGGGGAGASFFFHHSLSLHIRIRMGPSRHYRYLGRLGDLDRCRSLLLLPVSG